MDTTIQTLERVFKMGATILRDIDPTWPVERVLAAYTPNYPFLANATVGEPTIEGEQLVYPIQRPAAQTKGARAQPPAGTRNDEAEKALAALDVWLDAPVTTDAMVQRWRAVDDFLSERRRAGTDDSYLVPTLIPMA